MPLSRGAVRRCCAAPSPRDGGRASTHWSLRRQARPALRSTPSSSTDLLQERPYPNDVREAVSRVGASDGWRNNGSPSEGVRLPESRHKFLYERLGDHDFQLLVNALLTARFKGHSCVG
jgi:hypothetical protein